MPKSRARSTNVPTTARRNNARAKPAAASRAIPPSQHTRPRFGPFLVVLLVLILVLLLFFFRSFSPGYTLFSNDGPLGRLMSQYNRLPQKFSGAWQDLNSIGYSAGGAAPNITSTLLLFLGRVGFSKFYAPLSLLILGLGAGCFFRQLGLAPVACVLGALAATLNSGFFSAACWGVAAHPLSIAMSFFALAALVHSGPRSPWLKAAVAGFAVGIGVAEGADVGAIFSVYVAAFALFWSVLADGSTVKRLSRGIGQVMVMAAIAGLVAAQTVSVLIATQVPGVAAPQMGKPAAEARWDWATQWSLPKREALNLLVPGLFGYRMDTPGGGNYWGAAGREAAWDRYFASGRQGEKPVGVLRFTGGGNYAGILVVLVALWAAVQASRGDASVFPRPTRRVIYFWLAVLFGSLLLAFGRYAPFYRLFYELPYSSTIRNPAKFVHVVNWALVILFAHGIHGMSALYLSRSTSGALSRGQGFGEWWAKAAGFERRWLAGCGLAIAVSVVAALVYASSGRALQTYLQAVGFDETRSRDIAVFSFREVGWYLLFLMLGVGMVLFVGTGWFAGRRSRLGGVLLGLLLVADLGRANLPWIVYWDYPQKYATNPIIDSLRERPYEHRVATVPPWLPPAFRLPGNLLAMEGHWNDVYQTEWLEHLFPYYDVQSSDLVQLRTAPRDLASFENALQCQGTQATLPLIARRWQLTDTRYVLGCAALLPLLNRVLDPLQHRFSIVSRFEFSPKPGIGDPKKLDEITAVPSGNGTFALFDFAGALPRARLYSNWQVVTNDEAALNLLTNVAFDPVQTVLVSNPIPASLGTSSQTSSSVTFVSYAPKEILLQATAPALSVLLLNDRFDPDWKVWVDGKPATLLRCNFLMRGVVVPPGEHQIQFRFSLPLGPLYVSLGATALGLVLSGFVFLRAAKTKAPEP